MARKTSPIAFVLSGGAALGAIQVGMLRALYERGVEPDLIVATSAGAINGAFIATREQTVETADELAEIWRHVRRGQVFPLNPLSGLLGFLGTRAHLVPDSGLRRLIAEHLDAMQLEDLAIPLHVVAVDHTPSNSAPATSTCCPPVTRARWSAHPAARSAWRCTRSACSRTAGSSPTSSSTAITPS